MNITHVYVIYNLHVTEHKRKLPVIPCSLRVVVVHRDCIMCVSKNQATDELRFGESREVVQE